MIAFWLICGLLLAGALALLLPPLLGRHGQTGSGVSRAAANVALYRDQLAELDADRRTGTMSADEHEQARREIENRLLEDAPAADISAAPRPNRGRAAAIAVALLVPLCAVLLYVARGNPGALPPPQTAAPHGLDSQQTQAMIERLAQRLEKNPEDGQGWVMLARSYLRVGRIQEARSAYAKAAALLPLDAQLLADYADVLALAQGRRLQGEPEKIVRRALDADPKNLKALALSGSVAFEKKEFATAVEQWQRLLVLIPPDSDLARRAGESIKQAQDLAAANRSASKATEQREASAVPRKLDRASASASGVSVTIELSPALAGKVAPQDTLFIFATLAEGSRHPLAIMRRQAGRFPARVTLDDTMTMSLDTRLSSVPRLIVGAHISKTGVATARSGDLQGFSPLVKPDAQGIVVLIDREVP